MILIVALPMSSTPAKTGENVFFVWVTLTERKWVILRERRHACGVKHTSSEALDAPGARQVPYLQQLMLSRPVLDRVAVELDGAQHLQEPVGVVGAKTKSCKRTATSSFASSPRISRRTLTPFPAPSFTRSLIGGRGPNEPGCRCGKGQGSGVLVPNHKPDEDAEQAAARRLAGVLRGSRACLRDFGAWGLRSQRLPARSPIGG